MSVLSKSGNPIHGRVGCQRGFIVESKKRWASWRACLLSCMWLMMVLNLSVLPAVSHADDGKDLWNAAFDGNLSKVLALIEEGVDIDRPRSDGVTALMLAAQNGHEKIVQALLAKGADINHPDNGGQTALIQAAAAGHERIVKDLLIKGAKIDSQMKDGTTALFIASEYGQLSIVQILLAEGAEMDHKANNGVTALLIAAIQGHEEIVKALLDKGASIELGKYYGNTALNLAKTKKIKELLLKARYARSGPVSKKDNEKLVEAAFYGDLQKVRSLMEKGANIDYRHNSWTALLFAAQNGHKEVVKVLLAKGAKIDVQAKDGVTALIQACQDGHAEIVQALLDHGAQIDIQKDDGWTALMVAAQNGFEGIVKALLASGADINHQTKDGWTALILSAQNGHKTVVQTLLVKGAKIDQQAKNGRTALIQASAGGYEEIIRLLLEKGANANLKTDAGKTAFDKAKNRAIARLVSAAQKEYSQQEFEALDQTSFCELQEKLSVLGLYQGRVDGQMGPATAGAISSYQIKQNLKPTGMPSQSLLSSIRISYEQLDAEQKETDRPTLSTVPRTGTVFQDNLSAGWAPLQVVTADQGSHFYVKAQSTSNANAFRTMFLRSGETLNTRLPLGSYTIKYAAGKNWYGQQCLFGTNTVFNKADQEFSFTKQRDSVKGFRIELILQPDGNLGTFVIPRDQF